MQAKLKTYSWEPIFSDHESDEDDENVSKEDTCRVMLMQSELERQI